MTYDEVIFNLIRTKKYSEAAAKIPSEAFPEQFLKMNRKERNAIVQLIAQRLKAYHKAVRKVGFSGQMTQGLREQLAHETYQKTVESLQQDGFID